MALVDTGCLIFSCHLALPWGSEVHFQTFSLPCKSQWRLRELGWKEVACAHSQHRSLHATISALTCTEEEGGRSGRNSWSFCACLKECTLSMAHLTCVMQSLNSKILNPNFLIQARIKFLINSLLLPYLPRLTPDQGFKWSLSVPIHQGTFGINSPKNQNRFLLFSLQCLKSSILHYPIFFRQQTQYMNTY